MFKPPLPRRWLLAAALFGLLAGCATPPATPPRPGGGAVAALRQGQAGWRRDARSAEIAGELLWATTADGGLLEFSKTPFAVALVQSDAARWRAEFALVGRSVGGKLPGPTGLGWLRLEQAFLGNPAPPPWEFSDGPDGRFKLENPNTGESIKGFLAATQKSIP
jgi:hypothetical protein